LASTLSGRLLRVLSWWGPFARLGMRWVLISQFPANELLVMVDCWHLLCVIAMTFTIMKGTVISSLFLFLDGPGIGTQGFTLTKQVLYS
jgi:hypothetical protein